MSTSKFQRYLYQHPIEAARLEKITDSLRLSAMPEIKAAERSEQITNKDLSITVNYVPVYY